MMIIIAALIVWCSSLLFAYIRWRKLFYAKCDEVGKLRLKIIALEKKLMLKDQDRNLGWFD